MLNLEDREWKEFKIGETFDTDKGVYLHKKHIKDGRNPYVSAKTGNNGIVDYISNDALFNGNCITIEKIKFSAYYQPHPFYCSHDVSVLSSIRFSKYSALFISNMIMKQGNKYSYGRQAQLNVTKRQSILLPVNKLGEPDYEFMEQYIKEYEKKKRDEYLLHCRKQLRKMQNEEIHSIENIEWQPFYIKKIFEKPQRGKRIVDKNHIEGITPLVSSYGQKNGVTHFIGNEDKVRKFTNCLSIANGGSSAGKAFYHPYTFVAADHVTQCWNANLNQYQYLFLATVMTKALTGKYSFSHEISDPRLAKERIMLPVTESGEPDYNYMEQYIKNLMIKKYQSYLDYVEQNK
ncbi:hypothetical protein JCM1393_10280 [Clostridium carnis]